MINAISGISYDAYDSYGMQNVRGISAVASVSSVAEAREAHMSQADIKRLERSGQIECETCKNRKYQDGSDEMVSFKAPGHISPSASASRVMSHEREHVANANAKVAQNENAKLIQASVTLHTAVCPECGRTYVSGGETTTQIKYQEANPYGQNFKSYDAARVIGQNVDLCA